MVDTASSLGQNRLRLWRDFATDGTDDLIDQKYDVFIDACGLACPMPLIKARQALMVVEPGAIICVIATDPTSQRDFDMFIEATGHRLLRHEKEDDVFLYVIEKVAIKT